MIDQLRLFWSRPLDDGDRHRLFAAAGAIIAVGALILPLAADRAPDTRTAPRRTASSPVRVEAFATSSPVPKTAMVAPSEEGTASNQGSPADVAASRRAAREFLADYLPYTYGRQRSREIANASAELARELNTNRPRVPATERHLRPRLVLLQTDGVSHDHADLHALVEDGSRRYSVALELERTPTGWTVTRAGG